MRSVDLFLVLGAALGCAISSPGGAARLPDTGIDLCYDASIADTTAAGFAISISRDAGTYPRQDCRYGADVAAASGSMTKIGAGAKGFDYTKIANNGTVLAAGAGTGTDPTDWACTRDNHTGLTWEVKTSSNSLRYVEHTYQWFDANGATNGGNQGGLGGATCSGSLVACQTQNFRVAVNAAGLCGASDWRMPTVRELQSLIHFGALGPMVDTTYFPFTSNSRYWSANSWAGGNTGALYVDYSTGQVAYNFKTTPYRVRLVRGTPF